MKYWIDGDITKKSILELDNKYDVIIHCGGSGSVGYSMNHVKDDFKKTVDSTKEVLEFMKYNLRPPYLSIEPCCSRRTP